MNHLISAGFTVVRGNALYFWSYDSFGNRTTHLTSNEAFTGTLGSCQAANDAHVEGPPVSFTSLNQVAGYNYDAAGEVSR